MTDMSADCSSTIRLVGKRRGEVTSDLRAHAEGCHACRVELDGLEALIGAGREAECDAIAPARSERVRKMILEQARRPREAPRTKQVWPWAAAALVLLSATGWWGLRSLAPDARSQLAGLHGTVSASDGARFTHASDSPDEVVRLTDGGITISVSPLGPNERFRVIVGDAEVEVRGTEFEVVAAADHLVEVRVEHGRVEVRVEGSAPILLDAGQHWSRPEPADATLAPDEVVSVEIDDVVEDELPARPTATRRHDGATSDREPRDVAVETARTAPESPEPVEPAADRGFEAGWMALRAGDAQHAADLFEGVLASAPSDPLAEDAGFWRAVALSRCGRADESRRAFASFLATFPGSSRRAEVAVMLGWLLIESGDRDAARASFVTAADDTSERVRTSARRGLARLDELPEPVE